MGFIDDNFNLVNSFSDKYKGIIFFYNKKEIKSDLNLIQCKTGADLQRSKKSFWKTKAGILFWAEKIQLMRCISQKSRAMKFLV